MVDIVIPNDLWDTDDEGVLASWTCADGTVVQQGALIAEITVEKAQVELAAPASGRLKILVAPDASIKKGQIVGAIEPV